MTRRKRILALGAAGGVLGSLCWLPLGFAPALPLALVPVMRGMRHAQSGKDAVLLGLSFGAVRYAVAAHFILVLLRFSPLAIVLYLMAIVYILPFAVLEAWGAYTLEKRGGLPRGLGFALLYAALECARYWGDLSFPADPIAHAFGRHPAWLAWTPWTGPCVMSLLAFGLAAILEIAFESRGRPIRAVGIAVIAVVVWLAPPATDLLSRHESGHDHAVMRVGIVQPCVSVREKLSRDRWPSLWQRLRELTLEAADDVDLVVWPETARPGPVIWRAGAPFSDPPMKALAARAGVPILYGCEIARIDRGRVSGLYNGAALARPGTGRAEWYGKQQLLPFVEGIPFAGVIGWDPSKRASPREKTSYLTLVGNFSPGRRPTVFEVGQARIGVLVCYEGFYPALARRYRMEGANTLCVITNDAWWGESVFASWHARMVAARAREENMPVVRAANSGVSSATDRFGRLTARTNLFATTTLTVPLEPSSSEATFYARHGDLLPLGIILVLAAFTTRGFLRRARSIPRNE